MKLISDWRQAWRWFSMQSMALAAAIQAVWLQLPPDMKSSIDPAWVSAATVAVLVLGGIGRVVDQPDV